MASSADTTSSGVNAPRLIVGLGNPGETYRDTRHNIGFMVLDEIARRMGAAFREEKRWSGLVAKFTGGYLLKPLTFMNESGRAVQSVGHFYKASPAQTLVVYDDVDLPLGRLRFRTSGSAAGHNGIRSLIASLGSDEFPRLKVGISAADGRPAGERMVGHVLGKFRTEEQTELQIVIQRAADAVLSAVDRGLENAMNLFNRQPES
ncbi:aminoacyl-tRNA hydrolase [Prosthecobacter sp.]|uniref:aminoacyl-tRNA hydrolase n=1 Tax=Prosthecobacter sp. TaxID=1965333 RepID=UPI00248A1830|nr:aminoacyl-tRNA hydrolase [Prosthecobacter sp.]MDI1312016.1 aminoacyl-tRNA hydrolase [Prosthecobacter sp.]